MVFVVSTKIVSFINNSIFWPNSTYYKQFNTLILKTGVCKTQKVTRYVKLLQEMAGQKILIGVVAVWAMQINYHTTVCMKKFHPSSPLVWIFLFPSGARENQWGLL